MNYNPLWTEEEFGDALLKEFLDREATQPKTVSPEVHALRCKTMLLIGQIVRPMIIRAEELGALGRDNALAAEAEKMSRFLANAVSTAWPLADQREARERLHALKREIKRVRP